MEYVLEKIDLRNQYVENEVRCNRLIDCFRYLRNQLADPEAPPESFNPLISHASELCWVVDCFVGTNRYMAESVVVLARMCVQFLGNAITRKETQDVYRLAIWRFGAGTTFMMSLLEDPDSKVRLYGSMVFYNCMLDPQILNYVNGTQETVELIFNRAVEDSEHDNTWCLFCAQMLLAEKTFLNYTWDTIDRNCQLNIVRVALDGLLEKAANDATSTPLIHEDNVPFLATGFVEDSAKIANKLYKIYYPEEFEFVTPLLEFLCQATAFENLYQSVRDDERILDAALTLLDITVKPLISQKEQLDRLAAKMQAAVLKDVDVIKAEQRPFDNFRTHLVRLLANMCYKHPANQKLIRERGGIALIMNSTPLDADNNFITEWSVFALRNLLEDCPENQRVVQEMQFRGFAFTEDRELSNANAKLIKALEKDAALKKAAVAEIDSESAVDKLE